GVVLILGACPFIAEVARAQPPAAARAGEADDEGEAIAPGLVATYRSLVPEADGAKLARVESKPAFTLGQSGPHPRIPPGPFEVTWAGTLDHTSTDALRFGAYLGGTLKVEFNGVTVLGGRGEAETSWVEGKPTAEVPP